MSNNIRINFKIDTNTKNLLQQKANELNTLVLCQDLVQIKMRGSAS